MIRRRYRVLFHLLTLSIADAQIEISDGFSVASSSSSVLRESLPATSEPSLESDDAVRILQSYSYDCREGWENWKQSWSSAKKSWCCQNDPEQRGCFDCTAELQNWPYIWTASKKAYCCKEENVNCHDCQADLQDWVTAWSPFKKEWCCANKEKGCFDCNQGAIPSWDTFKMKYCCKSEGKGCYSCDGDARTWTFDQQDWCCTNQGRGCPATEATTLAPVICKDSIIEGSPEYCNSPIGTWTAEKKMWCCQHMGRGCPNIPFDCDAGFANWVNSWSDSKKAWCCQHKNKGCYSADPYDCKAGSASQWSHEKIHWCCQNRRIGCEPFNCFDTKTEPSFWPWNQKDWCCSHHNVGCPPVITEPYDCQRDFANWKSLWSAAKQQWCCLNKRLGCSEDKELKRCKIWGDPHIITFDGAQFVFYREGDFWLIQSPDISLQGRFQNTVWTRTHDFTDFSSMTAVIISGNFIGHHKIQVNSFDHGGILCDGYEILRSFGSYDCGPVKITFTDQGQLIDSAMAVLPHRVVLMTLPSDVMLQVNRFPNFLNALVTMTKRGYIDGLCGNMNGNSYDETGKLVHHRYGRGVWRNDLLFSDSIPLHLPLKFPSTKKCPEEKQRQAAIICQKEIVSISGWTLAECMGDLCAGTLPMVTTKAPSYGASPCDKPCAYQGTSHTCRDRIQWTAANKFRSTPSSACSFAHTAVMAECLHCGSCMLQDSGCVAPPAYDCISTQSSWTPDYFDYCCKTMNIGCSGYARPSPPSPPPPPRIASPAPPAPPGYGCDAQCPVGGSYRSCRLLVAYFAANQFRRDPRSACENSLRQVQSQCPACGACSLTVSGCVAPEPYKCASSQSTWSQDHFDYCCRYSNIGCQSSYVGPVTTTPTTTKVRSCDAICTFMGSSHSCSQRIAWSALNTYRSRPSSACQLAWKTVTEECPICGYCAFQDAGCKAPPPYDCAGSSISWSADQYSHCCMELGRGCTTKAPQPIYRPPATQLRISTSIAPIRTLSTTRQANACDTMCYFQGSSHSCKMRISWSAENLFRSDPPSACRNAWQSVLTQCPVCKSCALQSTSCQAPRPYDCASSQSTWNKAYFSYCCSHANIGCQQQNAGTGGVQWVEDAGSDSIHYINGQVQAVGSGADHYVNGQQIVRDNNMPAGSDSIHYINGQVQAVGSGAVHYVNGEQIARDNNMPAGSDSIHYINGQVQAVGSGAVHYVNGEQIVRDNNMPATPLPPEKTDLPGFFFGWR